MNSKNNNKAYPIINMIHFILTFTFILWSSQLHAQRQMDSNLSQKALSVNIEKITIQSDSIIYGLMANFPHPILTAITVFDSAGDFIRNLADTTRWLGPDDIAQIGLPISEIWQPILEYHIEDPSIPNDPNLYNQIPAPLFTEILQDMHIPTSTMLVMDVSTSMSEKLDDAKEGARLYIEQLRLVDRAGIILFNHTIVKLQQFTNDKDLLIETINSAETDFGTAINDALMAAVQQTKYEKSRPRIIVYTDGRDNNSAHTPQAVIDSALVYNIPIYTISLGDYTIEDTLKRIADTTGGLFFKADSAKQMLDIYAKLSDLIKHFYIMAHTSPDPVRNNTWRMVDITVNLPESYGNYQLRGTGKYFVEGVEPADLSVNLSSITDTTIVEANDTSNAVMPGEIYQYQINIKNYGPSQANYIKISHIIPDSVHFIDATVQPLFMKDSLIIWQLNDLGARDEIDISISVQLPSDISTELYELTSLVELIADNDYNPENNSDQDTVRILFPKPSQNYDLSIMQLAIIDSIVVLGNDSIQVVFQGDTVEYILTVKNLGPLTAYNFTVWDVFPDSVRIFDCSIQPTKQSPDTIFWQFDSLAVGDFLEISLHAQVADSFPSNLFPLTNISQVIADKDTFEHNNFATTTVYAISQSEDQPLVNVDVAINQSALTDSFSIVEGDTIRFTQRGETYSYTIMVINNGLDTAQSVRVINYLPDSVSAKNFQTLPDIIADDSLLWDLGDLAALSSHKLKFDVTVSSNMPIGKHLLINKVFASALNEDIEFLANNTSIDTVYNFVKPAEDLLPIIAANPPIVEVGDEISVRVQVLFPIESWDIWVYLADGNIILDYADTYIKNTKLESDQWYDIDQKYTNTKMFTSAEQEQIIFELRTVDIFGKVRTAQAFVTVMSSNDFYLDRNVFEAHRLEPLGINFKLSSNRVARLDLFDISGKKITNLTEGSYQAGWNTFNWNGMLDNGQRIGSGLYFITLKSGNYNVMKKVMIVQ